MATTKIRTKDRALGKDKPSSTQSQRGISSRHAYSSTDHNEKASSSETKHKPNYLKPTKSSLNELSKLGKKNIISHQYEDNQKLLIRRRSFDKSPSASPRAQKSLISPSPLDRAGSTPVPLVPRDRKITVRSSSFGKHIVTTTVPRVSKTPKAAVRQLTVVSKPTKAKNTFSVNKKKSSSSCGDHTDRELDHETSSGHEATQEDTEDLVKEVEEVVNEVASETSLARSCIKNVPKSETEEDVRIVETEDEKINSSDISTCSSEDQNLIQEPRREDQEINDHMLDGQENEKISNEEEEEAKTLKEIEEEGDEDDKNVSESTIEEEETLEHGEEEEAIERIKANEGEEEESKQDGGGGGGEAKVVLKVQGRQEKKESPSAAYYNDVIEETASKLLEKRKNKVRALVGAFETVIDYESGSSK